MNVILILFDSAENQRIMTTIKNNEQPFYE